MREVLLLAERLRLGLPTRFRVDFADGRNPIDLPFDLVRTISTTGAGPAARQPAHDADRGPSTIPEAIRLALFLADQHRTSGELIGDIQGRWGDRGWKDESIAVAASEMAKAGELVNRKRDAGDGLSKGYGLASWHRPQSSTEGVSET